MESERSPVRESQDVLLLQAVAVLQTRYERYGSYDHLSPESTVELSRTLEAVAAASDDDEDVDRDEAVALAHRLVDNDQPELSPMWPRATG